MHTNIVVVVVVVVVVRSCGGETENLLGVPRDVTLCEVSSASTLNLLPETRRRRHNDTRLPDDDDFFVEILGTPLFHFVYLA